LSLHSLMQKLLFECGNNYSVSLRLALLGLSLKKVGEFSVGDAGN